MTNLKYVAEDPWKKFSRLTQRENCESGVNLRNNEG